MKYLLLATCLMALNAGCKEKDASLDKYMMEGCAGVYFDRENKDSIFCELFQGSYIEYRNIDNGHVYVYKAAPVKPDTVYIHDTIYTSKIIQHADAVYIGPNESK